MGKIAKLIKRKKDCVLILSLTTRFYKVIDIENYVVCMSEDYLEAEKYFNDYDLDRIRKERQEEFETWLSENVEE